MLDDANAVVQGEGEDVAVEEEMGREKGIAEIFVGRGSKSGLLPERGDLWGAGALAPLGGDEVNFTGREVEVGSLRNRLEGGGEIEEDRAWEGVDGEEGDMSSESIKGGEVVVSIEGKEGSVVGLAGKGGGKRGGRGGGIETLCEGVEPTEDTAVFSCEGLEKGEKYKEGGTGEVGECSWVADDDREGVEVEEEGGGGGDKGES